LASEGKRETASQRGGDERQSLQSSEGTLERTDTGAFRATEPEAQTTIQQMRKIMKKYVYSVILGLFLVIGWNTAHAADTGTKAEAVAMVKKAIEFIKTNGNEKAFAEISNPKGQFIDRDLYVVVYDMNGKCLAHGANQKMIGRDLLDNKDVDGKEFMKERVEMMKKDASGWQKYKFRNPVSNQIEPKEMYLERTGDLIVGCGVYGKE
jgi:cytochrome c